MLQTFTLLFILVATFDNCEFLHYSFLLCKLIPNAFLKKNRVASFLITILIVSSRGRPEN